MIIDKNIPIKNIFYMLTYAFKELKHNNYEYISGEKFDNIYDLFAEILSKGVAYLLKQGLHKNAGITSKKLKNDANCLNINVVTVTNDDKTEKCKTQRKAEYRKSTVFKSLPKKR